MGYDNCLKAKGVELPRIDTLIAKLAERQIESAVFTGESAGRLIKGGQAISGPVFSGTQLQSLVAEVVPESQQTF